ncbi:MAG: type II toxin-antitoxin system mRNA interferase toxin, RelE/StbE family [Candidatus Pacebacteria bacterium]|nr:type II toxin-antitoxin system mRNA interferase toxin, RelE/StbE family [Candidatus Paceibacterota bacterium]
MIEISFSQNFYRKLKNIKRRNPELFKKINSQLLLFAENPRHPSLRHHKLKGKLQNSWSISVTKSFRLIYMVDEEYYFFDLGFHSEIYK